MNALYLTPERKHEKAQESQRGTLDGLRRLLEFHAKSDDLSVSALEELALHLKLGSINLMTCARELRAVEEERKVLLREMERRALRFEPEGGTGAQDGSPKNGQFLHCSDCHQYLHPEDERRCEVCNTLFHWQCGDWQNGKFVCGACKSEMMKLAANKEVKE